MAKRKTIMLLVTYGCNLRCTYCYEPKSVSRRMTAVQAREYILLQVDKAIADGFDEFEVQFMGGEPLMVFPIIQEVSEWLWQTPFTLPLAQIFIPTNGTLLNDEMKDWFTLHKDQITLGLSFDGNRLMQNVNRSNSAYKVDLSFFAHTWPRQSVKMTLSPQTIGMLYEGVMFLYEQGLHCAAADLAMGKDVEWNHEHLRVFSQQLQLLADYYVEHPEHPRISLLDINLSLLYSKKKLIKKCGCGEKLACIDCDGTEYACQLFAPITCSARQAQASLSIDFTNHNDFVSSQCEKCLLLSVCTHCYGMNYLLSGHVSQQSAFTCKAFKIQFFVYCDMLSRLFEKQNNANNLRRITQLLSQIKKSNYE